MKILVVGNGGREHAMAWRLSGTPGTEILITKGNAGTDDVAKALPISPDKPDEIVAVAQAEKVDLVVVGPEAPLAAGLVDRLEAVGVRAFGPDHKGAHIEASKIFSHEVMQSAGVSCADYRVFDSANAAIRHLTTCMYPTVVKADGLASGKGVVVAENSEEAIEAVKNFMVDGTLGSAGRTIVVEEFLRGEEASFMVMTDGSTVLPFAAARDHKRVFDGDHGPNTGGMGAYSPTPLVDDLTTKALLEKVAYPMLNELSRRGIRYRGILYAGIMVTKDGPKVLEFNCRFGDPETQPVLARLRGDLAEAMVATSEGWLHKVHLDFDPRPAVCVVMASPGYPGRVQTGQHITGLENAARIPEVQVFHAGTRRLPNGDIVTSGGRVLGVTALGQNGAEARERAYQAAKEIHFEGMHYRKDIGVSL